MEKLLSSRPVEDKIPENYIFSPEKRPGSSVSFTQKANIPVIDLHDENNIKEHVMKACQEYGIMQVINHGVESKVMNGAMAVFEEIFNMSPEDKLKVTRVENGDDDNNNNNNNKSCKLYTSTFNYDDEETHYWRDVLRHNCTPLEECIKYWPEKPANYRETIGPYVAGVKDLGSRMLELISDGLGLNPNYFAGPLSEDDFLIVNHYPPCPDPTLTLGLSLHCDPNLVTVLQQSLVPGLQLFHDEKWFLVEPVPDSILVIVGNQLEVISNGTLKSAAHRAITNTSRARTSAAFFINPSKECVVQPAKELVDVNDGRPLYRPFQYKDFFSYYTGPIAGDTTAVLQQYKIKY